MVMVGSPGMVVGQHIRDTDLAVNVCKKKHLTNIRASTSDIAVRLTPPRNLSLDDCIDKFLVPRGAEVLHCSGSDLEALHDIDGPPCVCFVCTGESAELLCQLLH